jgi:hypothetical protein
VFTASPPSVTLPGVAAKEKSSSRWSAWLAPILFLLAAVPAPALTCGALETRAWEKTSSPLESRPVESLQLLNLHQQNEFGGYDDALGSPLAAESEAEGGVYLLRDPETGQVMRTGRTNDLARRAAEHARNPALCNYDFETVYRTDVYAEQRGLEQELDWIHSPPLNKISPINPQNPNLQNYLNAANNYLDAQSGHP